MRRGIAVGSIVMCMLWFMLSIVVELADVQDNGFISQGHVTWAEIIRQARQHAEDRSRVIDVLLVAPFGLIYPLILTVFLPWVARDAKLALWQKVLTIVVLLVFAFPAVAGITQVFEALAAVIKPSPGMLSEPIAEGWFMTGALAFPYLAIVLIMAARLRARHVPWLRLRP